MSREEFLLYTNGLWNFSGESKKRLKHPAPFPRELPRRCIKLFLFWKTRFLILLADLARLF